MEFFQAIILGIVQALTEYLPVSSSAHIRIIGDLMLGADPGAAFTAIIQIGTELAVILYFRRDIINILSHWFGCLFGKNGKATPTAARLDKFFADRCFPSTRQNAKELLAIAGLTLYQPKLICRKTHGIVAHDHYWIRYADDPTDLS